MTQEQWDSLPEAVRVRWLEEIALGAPTEELKTIMRWCLIPDNVEPVPGTQWRQ